MPLEKAYIHTVYAYRSDLHIYVCMYIRMQQTPNKVRGEMCTFVRMSVCPSACSHLCIYVVHTYLLGKVLHVAVVYLHLVGSGREVGSRWGLCHGATLLQVSTGDAGNSGHTSSGTYKVAVTYTHVGLCVALRSRVAFVGT